MEFWNLFDLLHVKKEVRDEELKEITRHTGILFQRFSSEEWVPDYARLLWLGSCRMWQYSIFIEDEPFEVDPDEIDLN